MAKPKIFVGTLYAGEAEFEESCEAIKAQEQVDVTHHVIADLPEYEAHNELWNAWGKVRAAYDIFVKVDADTILNRNEALSDIYKLFQQPRVTGVQIKLHDYFSDQLISGLNAFSTEVQFQNSKKRLFADHADRNHDLVIKGEAVSHLAPIGWHCKYPAARQAYHYGLRRALKKQSDIVRRCASMWLKYRDDARAWALTGAMEAGWIYRNQFNYSDERFEKSLNDYQNDSERLIKVENYANAVTS